MTVLQSLSSLPNEFVVDLSDSMVISLKGEQADNYLHGQITVNINALSHDSARHYVHCDNKGKAWSLGYVTRHDEKLLMLTNQSSGTHSLAQLNKYGVFSKVEIRDATDDYSAFFISQPALQNILGELIPNIDDMRLTSSSESGDVLTSASSNHGVVFNSGLKQAGVIALIDKSAIENLQNTLATMNITHFDQTVFDALQIESAHPVINEISVSEYVPQMMNVQALHAIDFDKGCYMGQEVVARTRFLGKNKRAAFSFKIDSSIDIAPGDSIEKKLGEHWRVAGKIISVSQLESETWFMAVLTNDTQSKDLHRLADNPDITCYPIPLPYNIDQNVSNIVKKRR